MHATLGRGDGREGAEIGGRETKGISEGEWLSTKKEKRKTKKVWSTVT